MNIMMIKITIYHIRNAFKIPERKQSNKDFSRKQGVGGVERNLKMGGTTNTILSFLWYSPYGYSRKHPPPTEF